MQLFGELAGALSYGETAGVSTMMTRVLFALLLAVSTVLIALTHAVQESAQGGDHRFRRRLECERMVKMSGVRF